MSSTDHTMPDHSATNERITDSAAQRVTPAIATAATGGMFDPTIRRLDSFLPTTGGLRAAIISATAQPVIVLARSLEQPEYVVTHTGTGFGSQSAGTLSYASDPARTAHLAKEFAATLVRENTHRTDALREAEASHAQTLNEIRAYAIDRYREGAYCLDALNTFLGHFGLAPHLLRMRVEYTMRGSYVVTCRERNEAAGDAYDNLRPDLDDVADIVADSDTFRVDQLDVQITDD
jgi:hypothetical protein